MLYVALLRGINVGGSSKVDMKELTAVFEASGMTDVKTYINSGNVVFSTTIRARTRVVQLLEEAIAKRLGFEVKVLLRSLAEMRALVKAIPGDWTNDDRTRCDVLFLWKAVDRPSVVKQLPVDPELVDVRYAKGAVICRADRTAATRSGLSKLVGKPLYKQITIRNCNTTRRLLELMEERAG